MEQYCGQPAYFNGRILIYRGTDGRCYPVPNQGGGGGGRGRPGAQGAQGAQGASGGGGGGNLLTASRTLSAAEIRTANSNPITFIAAPGPGLAIKVIDSEVNYMPGGVGFTSNSFSLIINTATQAQTGGSGSYLTSGVSQTFGEMLEQNVADGQIQHVSNQSLLITTDSDSAVGNGTATIYLTYRLITL